MYSPQERTWEHSRLLDTRKMWAGSIGSTKSKDIPGQPMAAILPILQAGGAAPILSPFWTSLWSTTERYPATMQIDDLWSCSAIAAHRRQTLKSSHTSLT